MEKENNPVVVALLIILMIVSLAFLGVQKWAVSHHRAKEAELRSNLLQLRNAIEQYEADCGDWPVVLEDIVAASYFRTPDGQFPIDPFTGLADWDYTPGTGDVRSASILKARDGTKYSDW